MREQFTNAPDYAYRALTMIVAGCAYYMALRTPSLFDRLQVLKGEFDDQYLYYKRADSDRSSFKIVPRPTTRYGGR